MARYNVIVNPISGRGRGEEVFPLVVEEMSRLALDFEICRTDAPGHAVELAGKASNEGFDVVVAVGGDGTANEVLNGLMHAKQRGLGKAALGLISVGRGNDFAYGVGTPPGLEDACRTLAEDNRETIDVGLSKGGDYPQGRYFGNGVGIGFDTVVGFEALKMKRLHGFPSYIAAALKTIFLYYKAPTVRIKYEGGAVTQPALMVSVMNGRRLGGGFMMAPEGQMDDGSFDLTIVDQVGRAMIFSLILRFMQGSQAGHPAVKMTQTSKVIVTAEQGALPAHADGETLCEAGERLELEIVPQAVEVIVPGKGQNGETQA
jgi:YegS/Rv2252/BmrU family lipid kinase